MVTNSPPVVLIVDDEPFLAELLRRRLEDQGYVLLVAGSGEEALAAARQRRPDVALLDIVMPGMSGLEVCRRLRADGRTVDTQVVLVTALEGEEHMLKGLEAGADDFLAKSVSPTELLARVAAHLRSKARLDAIRSLEARRDELVHMLVHDIRSPLTSVILGAHLLDGAEAGEAAELQEEIRVGGERIRSMVDGLLLTVKSDDGELEPQLERVGLDEIATRVVRMLRPIAADRGISVRIDLRTDETARVDPDLVQRVVENLVSNALKASRRGDTVTVSIDAVGGFIELVVADQGAGVPAEKKESIFEAFKAGGSTAESIGLGLRLVKNVAEIHGGSISVEDAPEGGALFRLRLPFQGPSPLRDSAA